MEDQMNKDILLRKCKRIISELKIKTENLQNSLNRANVEKNEIKETIKKSNITSLLNIENEEDIVNALKQLINLLKKNEKTKPTLKLRKMKIENKSESLNEDKNEDKIVSKDLKIKKDEKILNKYQTENRTSMNKIINKIKNSEKTILQNNDFYVKEINSIKKYLQKSHTSFEKNNQVL
jgi:hypothetical protein